MEQNYLEKIILNTVDSEEWGTGEGTQRGLPCEGCSSRGSSKLGFVGTHIATSAQSWSFQVCVSVFDLTSLVQPSTRQPRKQISFRSLCQQGVNQREGLSAGSDSSEDLGRASALKTGLWPQSWVVCGEGAPELPDGWRRAVLILSARWVTRHLPGKLPAGSCHSGCWVCCASQG